VKIKGKIRVANDYSGGIQENGIQRSNTNFPDLQPSSFQCSINRPSMICAPSLPVRVCEN